MLVYFIISFIAIKSSFVLLDGLLKLSLLLIQDSNLNERVALSPNSKRIRQDRVLEVAQSL